MLRLFAFFSVAASVLSTDPCEDIEALEASLNEDKNALDANIALIRSQEESTGKIIQQVMLTNSYLDELYKRVWIRRNGPIPFPDTEEQNNIKTLLILALEGEDVEKELSRVGEQAAKEFGIPTVVRILTSIKKEIESKVDSIHQEMDSMRDMSLFDVVERSQKILIKALRECAKKLRSDARPMFAQIQTAQESIQAFEARGQRLNGIIHEVTQALIENDYPGAYMQYPPGTFDYQMQMFFMSPLVDEDWADWVSQHVTFSIMRFPSDGVSVQSLVDAMWNDFATVQLRILAPWTEELAHLQAKESDIANRLATLDEKIANI
jgi:hypothetical protein